MRRTKTARKEVTCMPICVHKDLTAINEKLLTLKDFQHNVVNVMDIVTRLSVALMKKYEEEECKRLERRDSNNNGHAKPLFDSDIDSDIDDSE